MEGIVWATLTWVPATGQTVLTDPPAEPVHIVENASATESPVWGGSGSGPAGQGLVDDGLSDPWVANGSGRIASGTHYITRDGSSGTIELKDVLSAQAPTSTFTPYPPPSYGGGTWDWTACSCTTYFSVAVVTDPRAVTISSPIDNPYSYYKGSSQGGYSDRWTHQRTASGGMAVDSAVAWQEGGFGGGADPGEWQITNLPLTATPINFISSDPSYSWSLSGPAPSEATLYYNNSNQTLFNLFETDGTKFPLHGTVTVTATDSDGATFSNFYDMTFHLPYEVTDSMGQTGIGKHIEQTIASGVYPSAYYDIAASDAKDFDVSAALDVGEAVTAAVGQEEAAGLLKIAATIAKLTNLTYSYGGDKASTGNRNDGTSWATAQRDNKDAYGGGNIKADPGTTADPGGWNNCKLSWCVVSKWRENSWHADKYTFNGYDSSQHVLTVHVTDLVDEEPYFVQYQNSNGTPYSG